MDDKTKVQRGISDINQAFKERDVQARAKALGIPYVNLIKIPLNADLAAVLPQADAEAAAAAVFFRSGKQVRLAVADPAAPATQALVTRLKGEYEVTLSLCSEESLAAAHGIYARTALKFEPMKENKVEKKELGSFEKEIADLEALHDKIESSSFEEALNYVQVGGYKTRASDIHFQPQEVRVLVRFRIDGVLQPVFFLNRKIYEGILTEIKQLSHLKLNVKNLPQDGQYVFKINGQPINVRVSTLPSLYGEACVMRLLDSARTFVSFEQLGFQGEALRHLQEAVRLPHGVILITGPTGSGKTTTLYSMLKSIDCKAEKVITLEDPIEYDLDGITQSQVHPEAGYDFAAGLKAILRQDPDVIMVGEIRDLDTAETAVQAALTGHLVISTLHTNSAIESIPRLVNMGVKGFILAPALDLIVAQRLVRRLCPDCSQEKPITASEQEDITLTFQQIQAKGLPVPPMPTALRHAAGCERCAQTGYRDQLVVSEVLRFNQELRDLILENKPMPEIYDYIAKHCRMLSLHEDGVLKAVQGLTTLDEVYRVAA